MAKPEFHAAMTHWLAIKAGIPSGEAEEMAWAAMYPDISDLTKSATPNAMDPLCQIYAIQPFHFVPGKAYGLPSVCIAGSGTALDITLESFRVGGIIQMGIALHAYQDTWFHQGWSGLWEAVNDAEGDLVATLAPAIGHAKVRDIPDNVTLDWRWQDPRNGNWIDNRGRAREAAEASWKILSSAPFPDGFEDVIEGRHIAMRPSDVSVNEFERAAKRHLAIYLEITS